MAYGSKDYARKSDKMENPKKPSGGTEYRQTTQFGENWSKGKGKKKKKVGGSYPKTMP